ncbi:type II toxin-antitoxin system VapC family toxin [Cardiobacterium hominis]|jgi:PIN family toxin-antitoxin system, toxin component|uniref:type II toxin-antitoxin system VapC family toxin n=1 Tax=Cardiobacterium hominis TaxID=2718 RepID=UPI0024925703|nr:type II toxin-antitoxin system VapC family toxin [Cardiobacterium hominis]
MYLLDTNIISELKKLDSGKIHPQVQRWAYSINLMQTKISVVSITEIRTGILSLARKDQAQAASLDNWFTNRLLPAYRTRTLSVDTEVALICAQLHIPAKRPINDAYIAATAIAHNLTPVTRNVRDFQGLPLMLENPFE